MKTENQSHTPETNFTLAYTTGNEVRHPRPMDSYDTIQDCIDWADENKVAHYLLMITEWNGSEIVASVNLEHPVADKQDDLSMYIVY